MEARAREQAYEEPPVAGRDHDKHERANAENHTERQSHGQMESRCGPELHLLLLVLENRWGLLILLLPSHWLRLQPEEICGRQHRVLRVEDHWEPLLLKLDPLLGRRVLGPVNRVKPAPDVLNVRVGHVHAAQAVEPSQIGADRLCRWRLALRAVKHLYCKLIERIELCDPFPGLEDAPTVDEHDCAIGRVRHRRIGGQACHNVGNRCSPRDIVCEARARRQHQVNHGYARIVIGHQNERPRNFLEVGSSIAFR